MVINIIIIIIEEYRNSYWSCRTSTSTEQAAGFEHCIILEDLILARRKSISSLTWIQMSSALSVPGYNLDCAYRSARADIRTRHQARCRPEQGQMRTSDSQGSSPPMRSGYRSEKQIMIMNAMSHISPVQPVFAAIATKIS